MPDAGVDETPTDDGNTGIDDDNSDTKDDNTDTKDDSTGTETTGGGRDGYRPLSGTQKLLARMKDIWNEMLKVD